jgi:hypothetical protein
MGPPRRGRTGYRHPLAFLLGLEGLALLRAYAGDGFDREFVATRMAEIRALLDQAAPSLGDGVELGRAGAAAGYREWSATYDEPGNPLIEVEEPVVRQVLGQIPPGRALYAARHGDPARGGNAMPGLVLAPVAGGRKTGLIPDDG